MMVLTALALFPNAIPLPVSGISRLRRMIGRRQGRGHGCRLFEGLPAQAICPNGHPAIGGHFISGGLLFSYLTGLFHNEAVE